MLLAQKAIRKRLKEEVEAVAASDQASAEVKEACQAYLDTFNCGVTNGDATDKLVAALGGMRLRDLQGHREEQRLPGEEIPVDLRW